MPFDPDPVSLLPLYQDGGRLVVRWTSTAPPGTHYQVYIARRLAWHGTNLRASLPVPASAVRVDVGAVLASEAGDDLSDELPVGTEECARLRWLGGTFLDATGQGDVAGFRIYRGPTPDAAPDYATPIADLAAYTGEVLDGYGMGGYGQGGYGFAASSYEWISGPLSHGLWTFAVRPYDAAGNEGPAMTTNVAIVAPPPPPPINPATRGRMWYTYDPVTHIATLHWLPAGV